MNSLSLAEVKKIAALAKLAITEEEAGKFLGQLSDILEMARMLNEVDTENIEPIAQITGINNMVYADIPQKFPHTEKLLAQSPQEIKENMIKVKNIF